MIQLFLKITHENTLFFLTHSEKRVNMEHEVYNNPG